MLVVGNNYFVRTDTDHWTGRLVSVDGPYTLTLVDFAWIADTGRFSEFLAKGDTPETEVEAAPDGMTVTLNFRAVISWPHPLPRVTK